MNFRMMMGVAIAGLFTACSANISVHSTNAATDSAKTPVADNSENPSKPNVQKDTSSQNQPSSELAESPSQVPTPDKEFEPLEDPRSDRTPWQIIKKDLSKGKSYAEFRQSALSWGWAPVVDPNCKTNVGGTASICDERPEVESCSGDGYCILRFQHRIKDVALKVVTYADNIQSWQFTRSDRSSVTNSSGACPSQDFTQFLAAFSSDKAMRDRYTLPQIRVIPYTETLRENPKAIFVPKEQYKDFTLVYKNGDFYNVDSAGNIYSGPLTVSDNPKPDRQRLNVIQQGNDYFVKTLVNMSEGNSWLFKRTGDCWSLAEDPEAPSP
jgi:hypothetical protein